MADDLEATYRAYIDALNERRFGDLGRFLHDRVAYNGTPGSLEEYQARRAAEAKQIPDLRYEIQLLVAGRDQVAARLWFDCTPQGEFLGLAVNGRRVSFAEHVFYRFRDGRIDDVWSHIDADAVRRQVAG